MRLIVLDAVGDGLDELGVIFPKILASVIAGHGDHEVVFQVDSQGRRRCRPVGKTHVRESVAGVPLRTDAVFRRTLIGGDGADVDGEHGIAGLLAHEPILTIASPIEEHLADLCHIHCGGCGIP